MEVLDGKPNFTNLGRQKFMYRVLRVKTRFFLEWKDKHNEGFRIICFLAEKIWSWLKPKDSDDF